MGPGALHSGRTLAPAPGLPPGSGRNRGAGGRGGWEGGIPASFGGEGSQVLGGRGREGGAEETLLQHGVSSPRGGCKHGTRAPFQGSPLKGQRLRRDRGSAAAFITSGARRTRRRAGFLRRSRGRRLSSCGVLAGPSLCGCVAGRTAVTGRCKPGSSGPQARPKRPARECPKATQLHLHAFQGADTSCLRLHFWKMG